MVCLQENRTRSVSTTLQQLHKDASIPLEPQWVSSLEIKKQRQKKRRQNKVVVSLGWIQDKASI